MRVYSYSRKPPRVCSLRTFSFTHSIGHRPFLGETKDVIPFMIDLNLTTIACITNLLLLGGGRAIHNQHSQQPQQQQVIIVQNRHKSPTKMPVTATVGGGAALPLYPRCSCCPFGYHIDLDFINYCQSLGKEVPSPGQKLRRDRRRQRQSMEIMLGLGPMFQQLDTLQMLPKVGEVRDILRCTALSCSCIEGKRMAN